MREFWLNFVQWMRFFVSFSSKLFSKGLVSFRAVVVPFLYPAFCLGCRMEGDFLCTDCRKSWEIQEQVWNFCPLCRRKNLMGRICDRCRQPETGLDGLITPFAFQENALLMRCIYAFKYEFIQDLAVPLSEVLVRSLTTWLSLWSPEISPSSVVLIPVPLHLKRLRFRGFNQSEMLTRHLLSRVMQPVEWPGESLRLNRIRDFSLHQLLERTHFSRPQMELARSERFLNVRHSFRLVDEHATLPAHDVLILVDDVATTLSTLEACAKILKQSGAKAVFGLVLAHGVHKSSF